METEGNNLMASYMAGTESKDFGESELSNYLGNLVVECEKRTRTSASTTARPRSSTTMAKLVTWCRKSGGPVLCPRTYGPTSAS